MALPCSRWFVDGLPIRVFRNYESIGLPYPNKQGMRVYSSIWNADNWATRGGLEKIDWISAPFIARYRQLRLRACKWHGAASTAPCASPTRANWWTAPAYRRLNSAQIGQMTWVRNNYMIYDYCKDTKRFKGQFPPECSQQSFWWTSMMMLLWDCLRWSLRISVVLIFFLFLFAVDLCF